MTPESLQRATGCTAALAAIYAEPITATFVEFGIDTPARQAAFLAQVGHESMGFAFAFERWGPTAAQSGYEGRADLGNTEPGDGYRFRGRGLIQVTGRANYAAASAALGVDLVANPGLLTGRDLATRSAGWFWSTHGCNAFADSGDFVGLTRRINGGLNGLADRQRRWELAKAELLT